MKLLGSVSLTAVLVAGTAFAGGVEKSAFSPDFLFEDDTYLEFSFGVVGPSVSGTSAPGLGSLPSGDVARTFSSLSVSYKRDINDKLSFGLVLDEPIGAKVNYPLTAAPYPFAGANAELRSNALTGLLKYQASEAVSVYGGLRGEKIRGTALNILLAPGTYYSLETDRTTEFGYVVGVAWEKPEIAARVALTYESERTHTLAASEATGAFGTPVAATGDFDVTIPQALTLDFQTGVAADTLVFGSVRYVTWTDFNIDGPTGPQIVSYADDRTTFNLGLGRRFNEQWSGAVTVGYEETTSNAVGNLGPTNGFTSVGVGATYTTGATKITAGIQYIDLGDATTTTIGSSFADNHAIAAGVRVGYSF